ncbi:MAG: Thioredoxin reductase, partial [Labilithrix sp.]|nr:Thioredoxin reductase [Labilithrix sp.]
MSSYLAKRIEHTENIEVLLKARVRRMLGEESLRAVEVVIDETDRAAAQHRFAP